MSEMSVWVVSASSVRLSSWAIRGEDAEQGVFSSSAFVHSRNCTCQAVPRPAWGERSPNCAAGAINRAGLFELLPLYYLTFDKQSSCPLFYSATFELPCHWHFNSTSQRSA